MLIQVLLNLKDGVNLDFKIKYQRFNVTVKEGLSIDIAFNPPSFSSDYTFKGALA
jgi:hypothetical protein